MASSFALQLQKFAEKAKANADLVVQKVTLDVARSVIEKSPVGNPSLWKSPPPAGYVGGRFRANWMFGVGQIDSTTTEEIDKTGRLTETRLAAAIRATKAGGVTYLSNSLPYAIPLEYGHSGQTPGGMVRVTVSEFQQYINQAVQDLNK